MFILSVSYKKPFAEVKANPDVHRAYPGKYCAQGKFVFSGRRNSRTGDVFFAARKMKPKSGKSCKRILFITRELLIMKLSA